jgi:hypothetical protein
MLALRRELNAHRQRSGGPDSSANPALHLPGLLLCLACVAGGQMPGAAAAQASWTIKGRVVGPDSLPIAGVTVAAHSVADSQSIRTLTDAGGKYRLSGYGTPGPYSIRVAYPGYQAQQREVVLATEDTVTIDFRLLRTMQGLAPVRAQAQRPKPPRSDQQSDVTPGQPGRLLNSYTVNRADGLTGDMSGDLIAALATLPGVTVIPDASGGAPTVSVFGLGGDQNAITLNGMAFGSSGADSPMGSLPRDGFSFQALPATYDPGRGGFTGLLVNARLPRGTSVPNRALHYSLETPYLQWTPPTASHYGARYSQDILSGGASGPIRDDRLTYNAVYQLQRRTTDVSTLQSASASSLLLLGISPDSIVRLVSILGRLGLPLRAANEPGSRITSGASAYSRFDYRPVAPTPNSEQRGDAGFSPADNQYSLLIGGGATGSAGIGGLTSFPATGTHTNSWNATGTGSVSDYIFGSVLNELSISFNTRSTRSSPYEPLPGANLLLNSTLPDGTTSVSTLSAAGSGVGVSDSRTVTWQLKNQTGWYTWSREHLVTTTLDGLLDRFVSAQGTGYGQYSYTSLQALDSGTPASYSRVLTGSSADTRGISGAIGIGDIFSPFINVPQRRQLQVQYGVRIEGNKLGTRPQLNSLLDSLFGRRTDHVPNTLTAAPMLGFSQEFGSFQREPDLPSTARGYVFGGARGYRAPVSVAGVSSYARLTGLSMGVQQLTCVGAGVPSPDWHSYVQSESSIPAECAGGATSPAVAETGRPVALFAPDFQPQESWRSALGIAGAMNSRLGGVLSVTYAANVHQPDPFDLNLRAGPQFVLANEANRPVFVTPASIVPGTGIISAGESRQFPAFASVTETRSDLRSDVWQLTALLTQAPPAQITVNSRTWTQSLAYAYTAGHSQARGFAESTAGDPRQVGDETAQLSRYALTYHSSLTIPGLGNLNAFARVASGIPYTPRVNRDINGDGLGNDRAFVFDPPITHDSVLASGMRALLSSAPQAARKCLERQLSTIAASNSCTGPWAATLDLSITADSYRLRLGNRGTATLVVNNALGALDLLLHGAQNLHGWAPAAGADATLLNVRGFDASTNQFLYLVNPYFGSVRGGHNAFRVPFRVTIDVRFYIGPDRETGQIASFLRPADADQSSGLSEAEIQMRMNRNAVSDFEVIARLGESLRLTPLQTDSLQALAREYTAFRNAVYTRLASYLAALDGAYNSDQARSQWHASIASISRKMFEMWPCVRAVLSADQYSRIPRYVTVIHDISREELERQLRGPLGFPR